MEEERFPENWQRIGMEGSRINKQGDECPDFFRIPSPVASPGNIGPDGSDKDTDCQEKDGRIEQDATDDGQAYNLRFAVRTGMVEQEGGHSVEHDESQQGIGNHDADYMRTQQRRGQHGHQPGDGRIGLAEHGNQQGQATGEVTESDHSFPSPAETAGEQDGTGCHELHGLVAVGQRKVVADVSP